MPNRLDAEAAELIETTLPARMEAENTAILRSRRSLQRLENKGRIQLNCSGSEFQWSVLRNELTAVPYVSGTVDYDPYQLHQGAVIGRRGYIKGVSIHKYDKLMNRGKEQIVDMWKGQINASLASVRRGIQGALYENGDGLDSYEGLETIKKVRHSGGCRHHRPARRHLRRSEHESRVRRWNLDDGLDH